MRVFMVSLYMLICVCIGTKPCKYFQLNAHRFDRKRGIFSKLSIDEDIPLEWRLDQREDDGRFAPPDYPVFVKPEWGQNAAGVQRADNPEELAEIRSANAKERIRYLIQQGAVESREFELFSIRDHRDRSRYGVFTIAEAVNESEPNPINSINNPTTRYVEITDQFTSSEIEALWGHMNRIGHFNISRASLRSDSYTDLVSGRFHVIEINLFIPLPINLLDSKYGPLDKLRMICRYMMTLARITRVRDKTLAEKPVFTKIMLYNRESRLMNYLRAKI